MHTFKTSSLILIGVALSSTALQADLPQKDLGALTVEEARAASKDVNTGEKARRLVSAALQAQRLDLIAVYFEAAYTGDGLRNYVEREMPPSTLRDRIVILLLKSKRGWNRDPDEFPYGKR